MNFKKLQAMQAKLDDQDIKPGGALGLSIERKKKLKGEGRNEA